MAKRRLEPSEHAVQSCFIDWVRSVENTPGYEPPRLSFAMQSGARVRWGTANKLKAEGMRKGVPDWWLPTPNREGPPYFAGLAIEFKTKRGVVSKEQSEYMTRLRAAGWRVLICRSPEEAIVAVKAYLGMG